MQHRADADLVMLACMGNQDASNELIRRYQDQAKRIALKIVRQEELAYEITQEAFLAAYLSLDQLRDPARFGNWLTSIVRNFALSILKEQRNKPISLEQILQKYPPSEPESFSPHHIDPEVQAEEHELQQLLLDIISTLSEKERSAVLLYYYQQHSIQEIAALLDISETAVKSRLFKARRTLRDQLAAEYETMSPQIASMKGKKAMAEEQHTLPVAPKFGQTFMRVIMLTYTEARQFDQPFIGTEHILLALLHTEIGETAELLLQLGMSLELTRQAVGVVSPHLPGEVARGMSRDALNVLEGCMQLTQHLQHQEQQPIHLLLSLLLLEQSVAHQVLQQLHIQPEHLRDQALQYLLGPEQAKTLDSTMLQQIVTPRLPHVTRPHADMGETKPIDTHRESGIEFDKEKIMLSLQKTQQKLRQKYQVSDPQYERLNRVFERSQHRLALTRRVGSTSGSAHISVSYTDVLMHANTIRLQFDHAQLGPEHLLYGILQLAHSQARAAQVLDRLQIERPTMLKALEQFLREQSYELPGMIKGRTTEAADEAMDDAYEEAYHQGYNIIGAEHILLGLVRRKDSFSAELMQKAGLNAEKIRGELALLPTPVL